MVLLCRGLSIYTSLSTTDCVNKTIQRICLYYERVTLYHLSHYNIETVILLLFKYILAHFIPLSGSKVMQNTVMLKSAQLMHSKCKSIWKLITNCPFLITFIFSLNIHGVRLTKQLAMVFLVWGLVASVVFCP